MFNEDYLNFCYSTLGEFETIFGYFPSPTDMTIEQVCDKIDQYKKKNLDMMPPSQQKKQMSLLDYLLILFFNPQKTANKISTF